MEKNCYITFVDEKYVTCVIRQMQRIKHLNTKYPYIILVGEEDLYTQNKLQEYSIDFDIVSIENFTTPIDDINVKYFTDVLRFRKTFNKFKILDYLNKYNKICWVDADVIFVENQDSMFDFSDKIIFRGTKNPIQKIDGAIFIITKELNVENFKKFIYDHQNIYSTDEDILNKYFSNKNNSLFVQFKKFLHFSGGVKLYQFDSLFYLFEDISANDFNYFIDNNFNILYNLNIEWANLLCDMSVKSEKIHNLYQDYNEKKSKTKNGNSTTHLKLKNSIQNLKNSISNNN